MYTFSHSLVETKKLKIFISSKYMHINKSNNSMTEKRNKIVLLGEPSVGKSSISLRISRNDYKDVYESTIGAAFHTIKIDDTMTLDIWDTAGQERYMSLSPMYYRNSRVILLVFDLNNLHTLDRLVTYFEKFKEEKLKNFACIIVGNKKDLVDDYQIQKKMHIITDRFEQFNPIMNIQYMCVSAKENDGIYELKDKIVQLCKELAVDPSDSVVVLNNEPKNISKCAC